MTSEHSPFYREVALGVAEKHFHSVLVKIAGELSFVFKKDDPDLIPGARVTATLPLSGFIELFGDLVEARNFRLKTYWQRNLDEEFGIPASFFRYWERQEDLWDK